MVAAYLAHYLTKKYMMKGRIFKQAIKIGDFNTPKRIGNKTYQWTDKTTSLELGSFVHEDTVEVLLQSDNVNGPALIELSMVEVDLADPSSPVYYTTKFQCGVDENGAKMTKNKHLLAAPCPPFCTAGK